MATRYQNRKKLLESDEQPMVLTEAILIDDEKYIHSNHMTKIIYDELFTHSNLDIVNDVYIDKIKQIMRKLGTYFNSIKHELDANTVDSSYACLLINCFAEIYNYLFKTNENIIYYGIYED